jgi:hypothetical protein
MSVKEIFDLEIQDVNMVEHKLKELYLDDEDWRLLVRHVKKINQCASALNYKHYDKNYLNIRLKDGSYISPTCIHYISRVFRGKEGHMENVDSKWSWRKWCSRKNLSV